MQKKTRNILAGAAGAAALAGVSLLVIRRQRQRRDLLRFGSDGEPGPAYGGWHSQGSRQQMNTQQWKSPADQQLSGSASAPEDQTQPARGQEPRNVAGPVMGTRYQPADQPDRIIPIPETGSTPAPIPAREPEVMDPPAEVTQLAGPMFQYLLAFQAMMDQLRARRRDSEGSAGARSLMPEDRVRSQEVLDRLENQLADYSLGGLEDGSLQERMYRLAVKVRDALQNLEYTDADLFRIYGEVRSEACRLIDQIQTEDLDLERVRNAYECAEE